METGPDSDWAAKGKAMVAEGSDGIWLRFGPKPDETRLASRFFAIRCNPCVSISATVLLFGWVIFCMAWSPGKWCLGGGTQVLNVTSPNATLSVQYNTDVVQQFYGLVGSEYVFQVQRQVVEEKDCYVPRKEFSYWMAWVTYTSTWLYIATQDVWIVFLLLLIVSKYGKLKLGPDDEPPEFSNIEWFSMIFCCGVATGLFYFSVGEPINHYEPCGRWAWSGPDPNNWANLPCKGTSGWANRYSHLPDNERAQAAMSLVFYHWGLHGWVCYAVVGCLLGLLHFRKGLPMTMKTCFYPLIGARVYSFWGDVIDVVSIVCTTFGVCTSLGMGVQQINAGLHILNGGKNWIGLGFYGVENQEEWFDESREGAMSTYNVQTESWRASNPFSVTTAGLIMQRKKEVSEQMLLIWIITSVSTVSICSGLNVGVKWLSIVALVLGCFLLWVVLIMDDTWFIANLFVQTLGHYLQYIVQVGTYTGAFDQPEHGAPDGRQEYGPPSGAGWMNDWTIFYWGWWISWAPFCGVFLARISKGRTVREFLVTCIIITVTFNFAWMTIWGGAALKMEMSAEKAGITCVSGQAKDFTKNYCRADPTAPSQGFGRHSGEPLYFCSSVTRLSCHYFNYPPMMFDVVMQYSNLGPFLSVLIILALFLYFVTSSDSGSLVDTMVAANGIAEPVIAQRVWWSLTEGLAATGLMYASIFDVSDPRASMKALQAASIAAGLPYTFLVCFMCVALWRTLKLEFGEEQFGQGFRSSVLDVGVTLYRGSPGTEKCLSVAGPLIDRKRLTATLRSALCPVMDLWSALAKLREKRGQRAGAWETAVAALVGIALYYAGWLLVCLDWIPIPANGYNEFGVWNGTYNIVPNQVSNRYGHFRLFTNDWSAGEVMTRNTAFSADRKESMGVGDRVGHPMHLAVFGWFFILFFVAVVTATRTSVREALKIRGSAFEDFLCSLFLWPMVLVQINETLDQGPLGGPAEDRTGSGKFTGTL